MLSTVLVLFGAFVALLALYIWRVIKVPKALEHLPSPVTWKFMKALVIDRIPNDERRKKFPEFQTYDVFRFFVLGQWEVVICEPEMARTLYANSDVFHKYLLKEAQPEALSAKFFGINLVFSNGNTWKRHHKVINPAFQTRNLIKISQYTFAPLIEVLLEEWAKVDSKPIDVENWMQRFTLDALGRAGFSFDLGSVKNRDSPHVKTYNEIMKAVMHPINFIFPIVSTLKFLPHVKKIHEQIKEFDALLYSIIEKRRQEKAENKRTDAVDLLDLMICAQESEGETISLSDQELRDNVVIFFLAGHDTTANSLSVALYMLARYPEVQEKARKEAYDAYIASKSPKKATEWIPTYEDQKTFEYITAVIKESLRLYPSVSVLPTRKTTQEYKLNETTILPANTLVTINIFEMQRNKRVWGEDAEEFKPERFLPGGDASTRHPTAFNAFGGGARSCIGQHFSLIEQRMLLGTLLLRYDIHLTPGFEELKLRSGSLLQPKDLYLTFKRRT